MAIETGRFELDDQGPGRTAEPYRDDDLIQLVDDLIDAVVVCRGGDIHDAGAQLSAIASFSEELHARLPEVIFEARCQDYRWREVTGRPAMPESTVRKRYGDYVASRKEASSSATDDHRRPPMRVVTDKTETPIERSRRPERNS